jgi:hypothetical protein
MLFQKVKTAGKSLQELRPSISTKANKIIMQCISAPPALGTGHPGTAVAVGRCYLRAQSLPFFIDWHRWRKEVKIKWWKRQVPKKWRHDNQKWQKIIIPYGSLSPCPRLYLSRGRYILRVCLRDVTALALHDITELYRPCSGTNI